MTPGPDFTPTYDYNGAAAPATNYVNGSSANPYDYPYYDYDYPFFGDGFFLIGGFGDHRRDRDHNGRGFNGTGSHQPEVFRGGRANSPASGEDSQPACVRPGFHGSSGGGHR